MELWRLIFTISVVKIAIAVISYRYFPFISGEKVV